MKPQFFLRKKVLFSIVLTLYGFALIVVPSALAVPPSNLSSTHGLTHSDEFETPVFERVFFAEFEEEDSYVVLNDVGGSPIKPWLKFEGASGSGKRNTLILPNKGDRIFSLLEVPEDGYYHLVLGCRAGIVSSKRDLPTVYWDKNPLNITLDGVAIKFTGDTSTVSGVQHTVTMGKASLHNLYLTAGTHILDIEARWNYNILDYVEILRVVDKPVVWGDADNSLEQVYIEGQGSTLYSPPALKHRYEEVFAEEMLVADGSIRWEVAQANKTTVVGFTSQTLDSHQREYSIVTHANGSVYTRELDVWKRLRNYKAGDRFAIERSNGVVTYIMNDKEVAVSPILNEDSLFVSAAFYGFDAKLVDILAQGLQKVTSLPWIDPRPFIFRGYLLDESSLESLTETTGFIGNESLIKATSGYSMSAGGLVSWNPTIYGEEAIVGLAENRGSIGSNGSAGYNQIDYCIYTHTDGYAYVFEKGVNRGRLSTCNMRDTFKIECIDGTVYYKKNGEVLFTSLRESDEELFAVTSVTSLDAKVFEVFVEVFDQKSIVAFFIR